jgi:hypothetical protein
VAFVEISKNLELHLHSLCKVKLHFSLLFHLPLISLARSFKTCLINSTSSVHFWNIFSWALLTMSNKCSQTARVSWRTFGIECWKNSILLCTVAQFFLKFSLIISAFIYNGPKVPVCTISNITNTTKLRKRLSR